MSAKSPRPRDNVSRVQRSTPLDTSLLVGLGLLDPLLQHAILARGLGSALIHRLGLPTIPQGASTDGLGLSPYRLLLLLMAVGGTVKQIFWILAISEEEMPPTSAVVICAFNTVFNSLNSFLFTCSLTSAASGEIFLDGGFPSLPLAVGCTLYLSGISLETFSEIQRKRYLRDPNNKGKPFTRGLFSLARHINYGGPGTLWRQQAGHGRLL